MLIQYPTMIQKTIESSSGMSGNPRISGDETLEMYLGMSILRLPRSVRHISENSGYSHAYSETFGRSINDKYGVIDGSCLVNRINERTFTCYNNSRPARVLSSYRALIESTCTSVLATDLTFA